MSAQMTWVHGNSGQIEVVHANWGKSRSWGWGLSLEGRVEASAHDEDPWIHFHIPMPSVSVEALRTPPLLHKVALLISTDYDPPDPVGRYPPASSNYYTRYKYALDLGGAYVNQVHLWDGAALLYDFNGLALVSAGITSHEEKFLSLPDPAEVHWGLGISVRIRFKNQMRVEKIEGTFQGQFGPVSEKPVAFEPEENPDTRSDTKSAVISSVAALFVPPGP